MCLFGGVEDVSVGVWRVSVWGCGGCACVGVWRVCLFGGVDDVPV